MFDQVSIQLLGRDQCQKPMMLLAGNSGGQCPGQCPPYILRPAGTMGTRAAGPGANTGSCQ